MKIAVVDPSLFTWPYDKALITSLRELGHEVVLYTKNLAAGERAKGGPFLKELFYPGFETPFMKKLPHLLFLILKGASHFLSMIALWLELRHFKPDIIHFQWAPLPVIDRVFIPLLRKIAPVILTVHDSLPFNESPKYSLQNVGAVQVIKSFDHLIVHTKSAKDRLGHYGIDAQSVSRIAHGVLEVALPGVRTSLKEDASVEILLFGNLKFYKGPDILIEALSRMNPDSLARVRVRIVGKPQMDTRPLFDLAKRLDVDSRITWDLRFIDDEEIGEIFELSDIIVMPYRAIDASGVLMVALSAGKPIVASNIGLFSEILQDEVHGYLVPVGDPNALAVALGRLVDDKTLRLRMADNVRTLGNSVLSWTDIAKMTEELYKQEIEEKSA